MEEENDTKFHRDLQMILAERNEPFNVHYNISAVESSISFNYTLRDEDEKREACIFLDSIYTIEWAPNMRAIEQYTYSMVEYRDCIIAVQELLERCKTIHPRIEKVKS